MFDLKIGFKCNNKCKHCVVEDKKKCGILDMPHIVSIINDIPKEITYVQVTGGEPSIAPNLFDILKLLNQKGFKPIIQSNCTGFSDIKLVEKCAPYIYQVHMAFHSCYPEVHDRIVGKSGMWQKTFQGMQNLKKFKNIKITSQTVLSQYNIETIYDTFKFLQENFPSIQMSMTYPHLMGAAYHNRDTVAFRYSDHKEIIQKTLKEFREYIFTEAIPPCYLYPYFPSATAEEDIVKGSSRIGIDFSGGFNKLNYNLLDIKDHRKASKCKECIYNNKCIGVWKEYIELFKNNLDLYPIKENN